MFLRFATQLFVTLVNAVLARAAKAVAITAPTT